MQNNDKIINVINESFQWFVELQKDTFPEREISKFYEVPMIAWKYQWLVEEVFNLDTYDYGLSEKYAKAILEVMKVIRDRKNFEYIVDEEKYSQFILVCNLLKQYNYIDWGTSIRGAWFDYTSKEPFIATTYKCIKCDDNTWKYFDSESITFSEYAVNYLLDVFFRD